MADADSIVADLEKAYASLEAGPEPTATTATAAPAVDKPENGDEPAAAGTVNRNEQGRFAKADEADTKAPAKPRDTLKLPDAKAPAAADKTAKPTETPADSAKAAAAPKAPEAAKPAAERIAPPEGWKGGAKVRWDGLPPPIQAEIVAQYQENAAITRELAPVRDFLRDNADFLIGQAGSLPAAMGQLMQFARMSVDNPAMLIQHIAASRGVDLAALAGAAANGNGYQAQPGGALQQNPPDIQALLRQAVQAELEPIRAQAWQQETATHARTIADFAANPAHPYFQDLRAHMGDLIRTGAAKDLAQAYDMAAWASPTTRQHMLDEQMARRDEERAAEAAKAKAAAAISLTGSPPPNGTVRNGRGASSVYDDLAATWDRLAAN